MKTLNKKGVIRSTTLTSVPLLAALAFTSMSAHGAAVYGDVSWGFAPNGSCAPCGTATSTNAALTGSGWTQSDNGNMNIADGGFGSGGSALKTNGFGGSTPAGSNAYLFNVAVTASNSFTIGTFSFISRVDSNGPKSYQLDAYSDSTLSTLIGSETVLNTLNPGGTGGLGANTNWFQQSVTFNPTATITNPTSTAMYFQLRAFDPVGGGNSGDSVDWWIRDAKLSSIPDPGTNPSPVPVPAAVWLFGSGLAGLIASARRKSKTTILA